MNYKINSKIIDIEHTFRIPKQCKVQPSFITGETILYKDSPTYKFDIVVGDTYYKKLPVIIIRLYDVPAFYTSEAKTFIYKKYMELYKAMQSITADSDYLNYLNNKELIDTAKNNLLLSSDEANVELGKQILKGLGFPKSKLKKLKYYE